MPVCGQSYLEDVRGSMDYAVVGGNHLQLSGAAPGLGLLTRLAQAYPPNFANAAGKIIGALSRKVKTCGQGHNSGVLGFA